MLFFTGYVQPGGKTSRNKGPPRYAMLNISSSASILQFSTATGKFAILYRQEGSYPVLLDPICGSQPLAWMTR